MATNRGYKVTDKDGNIIKEPARFAWLRSEQDGSIVDVVNGQKIWDGSSQTLVVGTDSTVAVQDSGSTVEDPLEILNATNALDASTTSTDGEVLLGVNESEISHDNISGVSSSDHHTRPGAGNALVEDGSNNFDVDESAISHDNIADVSSSDHHTRPSPGVGLSEDANQNFDVQQEQIDDWVDALLTLNGNLSKSYDDANDNLVLDTSALNAEETQDAVNTMMASSSNLNWNYDDANDTLTISISGPLEGVQIGTSSNRSDGYFATADANSVSTEEALIEGTTTTSPYWRWTEDGSGRAPLALQYSTSTFNGAIDPTIHMGYNVGDEGSRLDTSTHMLEQTIEGHYVDNNGNTNVEWNVDYTNPDGASTRFMAFQQDVTADEAYWNFAFDTTFSFKSGSVAGSEIAQVYQGGFRLFDESRLAFGNDQDYYFYNDSASSGSINILRLKTQHNDGGTYSSTVMAIEDDTGKIDWNWNHDLKGTSRVDSANGIGNAQRGDPSTSELASGENMMFNSDGSGTGSAGDLVYAVNDGGTIKTSIIAQRSNAT